MAALPTDTNITARVFDGVARLHPSVIGAEQQTSDGAATSSGPTFWPGCAGCDAAPLSSPLARAERDVLLGDDPQVTISKRGTNATLIAALPGIADDSQGPGQLPSQVACVEAVEKLSAALDGVVWEDVLPAVSAAAIAGLKFSEVLPPERAVATIAERLADRLGARSVANEQRVLATTT